MGLMEDKVQMQKSLIQRITKEAMDKIKNKKMGGQASNPCPLLLIVMGGDRDVDTALNQVNILSQLGVSFKIYLTAAAEKIITRKKILNFCPGEIISDSNIWNRSILDEVGGIIVPVLTLNGLSKIANMIADNPASNIILLAIREQKKILIARDSVVCCGADEPPATGFFMRKINEMISGIKNLGVKVTVAKNLSREAVELFNIDKNRAISNDADVTSICLTDKENCVECGLCVVKKEDDVKSIINAGASRISAKQIKGKVPDNLASYIDHTNLKAEATQEEIGKLCEEAKKFSFATVCINPANVRLAKQLLEGTDVGVTTVVGFPLGATTSLVKATEARDAIASGADEIDMVINVGALKSGNRTLVEEDIKAVREATRGKILKVILETALLSKEQIVQACEISKSQGADFVKTSTGFGPGGATVEDVALMRKTVGPSMGVKASGGIRTSEDVQGMIKAGASRIGASASVAIMKEKR